MSSEEERFFEKTLKASATFLARWRGASAELWQLTRSHRTLTIVLRREGSPGNLVIVCMDPSRIHGPVRWKDADIVISRSPVPDDERDGFLLVDRAADVEIVTGSLEVRENVKLT
jgi:hypothetical protein